MDRRTRRLRKTLAPAFGASHCCGARFQHLDIMHAVTPVATAMAADLVPSVEAYLEANGLSDTLKALKSEASAKKMTPSKSVRAPETPLDIAIFTSPPPSPDATPAPRNATSADPRVPFRPRRLSRLTSWRWPTCTWRPGEDLDRPDPSARSDGGAIFFLRDSLGAAAAAGQQPSPSRVPVASFLLHRDR